MNELKEKRTPELIGAEIRMYVDTGRRLSLLCGIEIGRRLVEAKAMLEHGEWLPWLERETEFSDRSAARYMKLFDEYGASQQGLFGPETNSPTLSNLPISKALALLSVPENDRIEFAESVDAEHISVRELEEKIREREARLAETEKQKAEAESLLKTKDGMLAEAHEKVADLAKQIRELESRPVEVAVERDEAAIAAAAKEAREKAETEAERAKEGLVRQLADAEKKQKDMQEKLQAAEKNLSEKEAELKGIQSRQNAELERATSKLQAELEETRKQLKASAADVTAFGIRYNTIQTEFAGLISELGKVRERDPETGEKLRTAMLQLLEYFRKEVE